MALVKCARCQSVFNKIRSPVCVACQEAEEQDFNRVREAVSARPVDTMEQIMESTGVSRACIQRMLDAGIVADVSLSGSFKCGRCGAPAISAAKKLCQTCLGKLDKELAKSRQGLQKQVTPQPEGARMEARAAVDEKRR